MVAQLVGVKVEKVRVEKGLRVAESLPLLSNTP